MRVITSSFLFCVRVLCRRNATDETKSIITRPFAVRWDGIRPRLASSKIPCHVGVSRDPAKKNPSCRLNARTSLGTVRWKALGDERNRVGWSCSCPSRSWCPPKLPPPPPLLSCCRCCRAATSRYRHCHRWTYPTAIIELPPLRFLPLASLSTRRRRWVATASQG